MTNDEAKRIIEALLFVSDKPLGIDTIQSVIETLEPAAIRSLVEDLTREYEEARRSFTIKEIAGGFQMFAEPCYGEWIAKLYRKPPERLSGPALETLAIIAYRQPITRSEMEAIRGVNVDGVIHTLEERDLIRTRGKKDVPGRPILYGTTTEFLQHFGLRSLDELPKLREFQEADLDFIREREAGLKIDTKSGAAAGAEPRQEGGNDEERPAEDPV